LDKYIFHITPYDIIFIGTIFLGLALVPLLTFTKRGDRVANRFLGLVLALVVLWMFGLLCVDIQPDAYWSRLPLHFSLALGPLVYFYVLLKTKPERIFRRTDLLHFSPMLLELGVWVLQVKQPNPVLLLMAFISVTVYLCFSYILVKDLRRWLRFNADEHDKNQLRWLQNLLKIFGIIWLMWIPGTTANHFFYHQPGTVFYYPLYIVLAAVITALGASAILKPELRMPVAAFSGLPTEIAQKGDWLRKAIETGLLYQDPDLSLTTLGEAVGVHPRELSRIINLAIGKNFNDLINEYRILDVKQKMQDPAYDRITLLGIAQSAGFNSKTTFNRAFRQMTGQSAAEYKNDLKKVRPNHDLHPHPRFVPVISHQQTTPKWYDEKLNRNFMFKNYLKITWRNLVKNKVYSALNISGLAAGMAVALLIGLWMWDELSFDKNFNHYDRIAQVMQSQTYNGVVRSGKAIPIPLDEELHRSYGANFKYIVMASWTWDHVLTVGDKKISRGGSFMGSDAPKLFSLNMLKGDGDGLSDPSSMLVSQSVAKALFGDADPLGKMVKVDNGKSFTVTGVYADFAPNTTFHYQDLAFVMPWKYYVDNLVPKESLTNWGENGFQMLVQIADNADMARVSAKIRDSKINRVTAEDRKYKQQIFLHPMPKWHLYAEFKDGINVGGKIQYVWLFGIVGMFVLLLACINFMNLSTAQSEKRAKEVGVRKAVGSLRGQLISQFFCESLLIALFSFAISLVLVQLALPVFNSVAAKNVAILWGSPLFWLIGIGFALFTGLIAGSYPALYLSSFQPVKVLKGTFKAGKFSALPRKALVVVQFAVSVVLIIGTIIVFRQIEYAKSRPVGYTREGLVTIYMATNDLHKQFAAVRYDLIKSGVVSEIAESSSPVTAVGSNSGGIKWEGKPPGMADDFAVIGVSHQFGKTVGWQFMQGRDFSTKFLTDSTAVVLNEAAVKYMGLKQPLGQVIQTDDHKLTVVGVIKNMVMQSPYEPVKQTIFYINKDMGGVLSIRINPKADTHEALVAIEKVCKTYAPSVPFAYKFVDDEYAEKFSDEERIGKLSSYFAVLAIFISCLGLFGMASFMAEQRTKEIGVRKVLGATVFGLWRLLSVDFITLIIISLLVSIPVAYYFMHSWLQHYTYQTELSWWIFAATAVCAIVITLLTVSYQSIKAALVNPVKSLKSE